MVMLEEHSAWLILPPTPYPVPSRELAKAISCGQVTHRNFCSKPKSLLPKIWHFHECFFLKNSSCCLFKLRSFLLALSLGIKLIWFGSCNSSLSLSPNSFIVPLIKVDFQDYPLIECEGSIYFYIYMFIWQPFAECLFMPSNVLGTRVTQRGHEPCSQEAHCIVGKEVQDKCFQRAVITALREHKGGILPDWHRWAETWRALAKGSCSTEAQQGCRTGLVGDLEMVRLAGM